MRLALDLAQPAALLHFIRMGVLDLGVRLDRRADAECILPNLGIDMLR